MDKSREKTTIYGFVFFCTRQILGKGTSDFFTYKMYFSPLKFGYRCHNHYLRCHIENYDHFQYAPGTLEQHKI